MIDQIKCFTLEFAPGLSARQRVFCMSNRAAFKVTERTTEMRIIYDASARKSNNPSSLDNYLNRVTKSNHRENIFSEMLTNKGQQC